MIRMHIKSSLTETVTAIHPHAVTSFVVPGRHYDYEVTVRPRKRRNKKASGTATGNVNLPTLPRWER